MAGVSQQALMAAAAALVKALVFVGGTTGNVATITLPSGIQAGDICIIFNWKSSAGANVTPSGFTNYINDGSNGSTISVSAKILAGTETTVTGMASTALWICAVYRPSWAATAIGSYAAGTASNFQNQGLVLASAAVPTVPSIALISFAAPFDISARRTVSPATMTEIAGATTGQYAHYEIFNTLADRKDYTTVLTDGGSNQKSAAMVLTVT